MRFWLGGGKKAVPTKIWRNEGHHFLFFLGASLFSSPHCLAFFKVGLQPLVKLFNRAHSQQQQLSQLLLVRFHLALVPAREVDNTRARGALSRGVLEQKPRPQVRRGSAFSPGL